MPERTTLSRALDALEKGVEETAHRLGAQRVYFTDAAQCGRAYFQSSPLFFLDALAALQAERAIEQAVADFTYFLEHEARLKYSEVPVLPQEGGGTLVLFWRQP